MVHLIVITPEQFLPNEAEAIVRASHCALGYADEVSFFVHLRKPNAEAEEMRTLLKALPKTAQQRIVLHSHFSLCDEFPTAGIHKNAHNAIEFGQCHHLAGITSYAAHSLEEIAENDGFSYYWLSPIFDSISKKGYSSNFDLLQVKEFLADNASKNVIALGGITDANAKQCIQNGFAGVAILGWLWNKLQHGDMEAYEKSITALLDAITSAQKE